MDSAIEEASPAGARVPRRGWVCGLIFLATFLVYLPAIRGGLLWDDDGHVTRPELQSLHGLWRIWFEVGATQQYYPVLHSAFWIEHRLWGDAPMGYHLVNILLHATAACLVGVILGRLWGRSGPQFPAAWLAAFLFALHPVCVESVAWISEQKNTLSTVFYLLAGLTYLQGALRGSPSRSAYLLATFLFVLAVLSKSVTATLPAALLVVIWWRKGSLSWRRDMVLLLPWFAIAAAAGSLTAWVESKYIGAQGAGFGLSLLERCLLAGRVIWFYLGKLFWPVNLSFVYPHWQVRATVWWQYLFPVAVVALVVALWMIRRRRRGPLAVLLFFIGTLFPALGFINVYPFIFSYVADHFQYLASLGVIAAAAATLPAAVANMRPGIFRRWHLAAITVLGALGMLTYRQCQMYRDARTLYRTTIDQNPDCWLAHYNLGDIFLHQGKLSEALSQYLDAVRIKPDYIVARNNLGSVLAHEGRYSEAIAQFEEALVYSPNDPKLHYNLGNALTDINRLPDAVTHYERALQLRPDYAAAHYHLALALHSLGRDNEATIHLQESERLHTGP